MQLEAEKIVAKQLAVCRDQALVKLIGVVGDAARNAVNVEGNMIFLDEIIQGGAAL